MGFGAPSAGGQPSITGGTVECANGTADRYSCQNVDLFSFLSIDDLGGASGTELNDVWGWTDPQTGTEYALVGRTDGLAFVDVSTPTAPDYIGELPTHSEPSTWRDMKVYQNHAFVVSEASGHGMQVFDLTQLRDVGSDEQPVTFSETTHYDEVESAHNIVINRETGFAYIVGGNGSGATCGGGLHMVDVEAPTAPTFVGCFADPSTGRSGTGYTHDAQCVQYDGPDALYLDSEVCFNANETALNIADVTDKENPETIANATYPQIGYVHQAWLTEDHRYLYVDDELDELNTENGIDQTRTLVFDVTDLDNPELVKRHLGPTGAIDHNQYIQGNYAYQANYQSGLRILNVANPESPVEVAHFDTYPDGNNASFQGAWSTYPFFERNLVLVSSIGEGLFALTLNLPPVVSFTATRQEQSARLRWAISAAVQTDSMVVQRKPPGAHRWSDEATVAPASGTGIQEYEYSLDGLSPGTHQMRLRHVSSDGTIDVSDAVEVRILPTESYVATGPAPNPARSQAVFEITLRETQPLRIALYDVTGRRVAVLHDGPVQRGVARRFQLPVRQQASGTYFLRVQGESVKLLRKVVVAR